MQQNIVTVVNINGIHCRPSSAIVKVAMKFTSSLKVESESGSANLKSMIEIITLAIHCGDSVTLTAEGDDELEAIGAISDAFTTHYDYPDK